MSTFGFEDKLSFNKAEFERRQAINLYLLKLEDIKPSDENIFDITEDHIQKLAENIEMNGLITPIQVQKEGDEQRIMSGECRWTALKLLVDQGKHYYFNDQDITGMIPVTYSGKQLMGASKQNKIISANAQREHSKEQDEKVLEATYKNNNELEKQGKGGWKGVKAKQLSLQTGIAEHACKDFLAKKNKEKKNAVSDEEVADSDEKEKKSKEVTEEEKALKKLKSSLNALKKNVEKFDWSILSEVDPAEKDGIFEIYLNISEQMDNHFNHM